MLFIKQSSEVEKNSNQSHKSDSDFSLKTQIKRRRVISAKETHCSHPQANKLEERCPLLAGFTGNIVLMRRFAVRLEIEACKAFFNATYEGKNAKYSLS